MVTWTCEITATIDADAVAYSDAEVRFAMEIAWSLNPMQYADAAIRVGTMRMRARIKTDSTPIYSFTPEGSVMGRMRTKYRIRTGP